MRRKIQPFAILWTVLVTLVSVAACSRGTATPTPIPTPAVTRPPTPLPYETPPPGLPPAVSLLPEGAWLSIHVEASDGTRWTAVAYGERDEIYDEANNRRWVDKGAFLSRQRHLWEALLRQARFARLSRDTYLTACDTCPQIALAVHLEGEEQSKGIWVRLRPYDAVGELLPSLPVIHALRLSVESVMNMYSPGEIVTAPLPPQSGEVPDAPLRIIYGDNLQTTEEGPLVGKTVRPWAMDPIPGSFTAPDATEAVAIVGGASPTEDVSPEDEPYLRARLVVFRKEAGTWKVVSKEEGLASNIPAEMLPAAIVGITDFDHDGVQEVLVSVASLMPGYLDGVYHLYRWDGQNMRRVWMTTSVYDNTTLSEQPDFATQVAWPQWIDQDGDGTEEIVLEVVRRAYERTSMGLADTSRIKNETTSDVVFDWRGKGFMLVSP